jgi:hypothetical protein
LSGTFSEEIVSMWDAFPRNALFDPPEWWLIFETLISLAFGFQRAWKWIFLP